METAVRVIKNSFFLMSGQVYSVLVNLLAIALISRYLPLEVFGDYGLITAVASIFMVLTDMGGGQIAIREMSRDLARAREIFAATLILRCLFSLISFGTIVLMVHFTSDSPQVLRAAYIAALGVAFFFIGDVSPIVFTAYERMEFSAILKFIAETCYILGIVAIIYFDFGLDGIFMALLLSYVARLIAGLLIVAKKFFRPRIFWDFQTLKWISKEALPLGINRLLRKASFRIDTILLQILRTREEVGLFHGVYRIILIILFIPRMITDALFPLFSRYAEESQDAMDFAFMKSFKFLLILVLPLTLVVFLLAQPIVLLLLGNKFAQAVPLLQLLSLVWGVTFFSVLCNKALNASNHQALATVAVGICLAVNLLLDLMLIPLFGYLGAAMATLAAEVVLLLASFYFIASRRVCRVSLRHVVPKPLLAASTATLLAYALAGWPLLLSVVVALLTYILMLFISNTFDKEEFNVLKALGQKVRRRSSKLFSASY